MTHIQSIVHQQWQNATSGTLSGSKGLHWVLSEFKCLEGDSLLFQGVDEDYIPPLACKFNEDGLHGNLLAVADEEGAVALYDTRKRLSESQISHFEAHKNAVFDLEWVPGGTKLVTASGDKRLCMWDMVGEVLLTSFVGHKGSVKSVCVRQDEPSVLVSGSRDGSLMVWDTRCSGKGSSQRPVNIIHAAHERATGKQSRQTKAAGNISSVTAVLFHGDNKIASCGASDGTVKLWDLRKHYSRVKTAPPPCWHAFSPIEKEGRVYGFNSLVADRHQSTLFASCTDDIIYKYSASTLNKIPVDGFSGHKNSMFYVKTCLSGDGQYLLSGSNCGSAYIWQVSDSTAPPLLLRGHSREVTAVDWCPTQLDKVATCSDDNDLFLWRVTRRQSQEGSIGECAQYSDTEHLKAQRVLESCRQTQPSPPPRHCSSHPPTNKKGFTQTQSQWNRTTDINTLRSKINSKHLPSPITTVIPSPTSQNSTPIDNPPTSKTETTPFKINTENCPHYSSLETPPSGVSELTGRKRKLVFSAESKNKKVRKTCSGCSTSPAVKNSVARRPVSSCSRCLQPSLKNYFKPQEKD